VQQKEGDCFARSGEPLGRVEGSGKERCSMSSEDVTASEDTKIEMGLSPQVLLTGPSVRNVRRLNFINA
jgi:hypothetical protein